LSDGSEPRFEDVDTFCCQLRGRVTLSLRIASPPRMLDRMVSGVPVSCGSSRGCTKGPLCLLKATLIGTGRKRKCSPKVFKYSKILEACQVRKEKRSAEQT
jgi:hypothetical protein